MNEWIKKQFVKSTKYFYNPDKKPFKTEDNLLDPR